MPKKKKEIINGVMIINYKDQGLLMQFGVSADALDYPQVVERHLGEVFFELIGKVEQGKLNAK